MKVNLSHPEIDSQLVLHNVNIRPAFPFNSLCISDRMSYTQPCFMGNASCLTLTSFVWNFNLPPVGNLKCCVWFTHPCMEFKVTTGGECFENSQKTENSIICVVIKCSRLACLILEIGTLPLLTCKCTWSAISCYIYWNSGQNWLHTSATQEGSIVFLSSSRIGSRCSMVI